MFCYQCEQAAKGTGCTVQGVCGKDPQTAGMQDLLLWQTKGVAMYAHRARKLGLKTRAADHFVVEALFTTVTNVNFDPKVIAGLVQKGQAVKDLTRAALESAAKAAETLKGPAAWQAPGDYAALLKESEKIGIEPEIKALGADRAGLAELLTYGLKGTAAYADHARILGIEDDSVYAFFHEALDFLTRENPSVDELFGYNMRCGEVNLKVMGMLDTANTGAYGHPVPAKVRVNPLKGKALLVSGHDLKDLENILRQTEGKGINVYTHGEMLPAHGYPGLKKYRHLAGNYGGAWQDQQKEFAAFPGAIVMTTNCIQRPAESYKGRIFTSGLVAWPGVTHITGGNFSPAVNAALAAEGFASDGENKEILVGFGHNAVMGVAGKVIDAVKTGQIKRFFLIGGCDGAKPGRNYYTEFAEKAPKDTVILTLACGKYRFNKMEFGDIGGIPRLLDLGQCNDAYSAVQVALALSKAFNAGVNELPLTMILSWYEQKAVCILLSLLSLGIKNIRLGPTLPAFVTPAVLKVLVEKFNIMPVTTAEKDLEAIMGTVVYDTR
ncbi:MAG: hydroxylamine reductase [Elusimicrobia bacterium GWA2_56_46]|nr:MAG: hydroxylamine reductase [Elusimicrobia bacterium GWA2_56_46]OGR55119.1 MAG: hydroxylamine reductase [Elusimicrobia bacterium GWC2_56_31]